jgi:hypothetical protein
MHEPPTTVQLIVDLMLLMLSVTCVCSFMFLTRENGWIKQWVQLWISWWVWKLPNWWSCRVIVMLHDTMRLHGHRFHLTAIFAWDCSLQWSTRMFCIYWLSSPTQIWLRGENNHHGGTAKMQHFAHVEIELQWRRSSVDLNILFRWVGLN